MRPGQQSPLGARQAGSSVTSSLTLVTLLVFVLFCLGTTVVSTNQFNADIRQRAKDRISLITQTINFAFEPMMDRNDLPGMQRFVENVSADRGIHRLTVVSRDLTILADELLTSERSQEQTRILTQEKEPWTRALGGEPQLFQEQAEDGSTVLTAMVPLRGGRYFPEFHSDIVGVIRLSYDYTPFHAAARRNTVTSIVSQCVTFLAVILALNLLIRGFVLKPIHQLATAAARLGKGDLAARVNVTSRTELGSLGEVFNDMAGQLQILLAQREAAAGAIARATTLLQVNSDLQSEITKRTQSEQTLRVRQAEMEVQRMAALNLAADTEEARERAELAEQQLLKLNEELEQRVTLRTAELEAANKELEAFSYSVSHDLRSPLRAIDGFSRILVEEHAAQLSSEGQRYLRMARENTQRMGQLIDDLLGFSRLNRHALQKRSVAPCALARAVLAELESESAGRNVEIVVGDLPTCQADPKLLKQVFTNLLSNALKYTRAQPAARVEIGCLKNDPPGMHTYFVKDNGAGFDMQYVHKLFGVFQRLHRAEDYEGTGVGLAIVQRIVHRHGGRVWAEAAVNQGATFYFTLAGE